MTVTKTAQNRIKILLTDTEVITCFGDYDALYQMTPKAKLSLQLLLNDIIANSNIPKNDCKISAKLHLKRGEGCEIILSVMVAERLLPFTECIFEFSDSESLTLGIKTLYKNNRTFNMQSHLYETEKGYGLIINCKNPKERLFLLNEFCTKTSDKTEEIEYTKEYGKPLILNCAIEKYGKAFS